MAAAQDKATVVRKWSAAFHAGVGGQGGLLCTDAAQAMAGENLIKCFQAVNEDPSIKCVAGENVHSDFCPWMEKHLQNI